MGEREVLMPLKDVYENWMFGAFFASAFLLFISMMWIDKLWMVVPITAIICVVAFNKCISNVIMTQAEE